MDIRIGSKVKIKKGHSGVFEDSLFRSIFGENKVLTIKNIDNTELCSFEETEFKLPLAFFELVNNQEKTNVISFKNDELNSAIIKYKIKDKNITFDVNGVVPITRLFKILLNETGLYNYTYERTCPFKISTNYVKNEMIHYWNIEFIDISDFKKTKKLLLYTNKTMYVTGSYTIFIPDFLELCVYLRIIERNGKGYKLIRDLKKAMKKCEYIKEKPTIEELEEEGFIVPDKYKQLANKEIYSLV